MKANKQSLLIGINSLLLILWATFLVACESTDEPAVTEEPMDELPVEIHTFEAGNFEGIWNSGTATATFEGLSITARIQIENDSLATGELFISSNFTSCCGSDGSDGPISFKVVDNNVKSFIWDDRIPNCEGTFNGSGKLLANNELEVTFTGTDCDGNHTGSLTLKRVE